MKTKNSLMILVSKSLIELKYDYTISQIMIQNININSIYYKKYCINHRT